jgi:hypothetical protein
MLTEIRYSQANQQHSMKEQENQRRSMKEQESD